MFLLKDRQLLTELHGEHRVLSVNTWDNDLHNTFCLSVISYQISHHMNMASLKLSVHINVFPYFLFIPQTAHLISGLLLTLPKIGENLARKQNQLFLVIILPVTALKKFYSC